MTLSRIALAAALVLPATTLPLPAAAQATLSADEVVIDAGQQSLEASGDVWFEMPPLVLGADRLVADMETGTLLVDGAFIDASSPDRSVTASAAGAIAGPGGALLEHGSASLCDCDPPPWCLEFTALSIDADGDVVVRRGWLVVGGRRVLPLPWLMLRTGREPGLLPPRFSHLPGRGPLVGIGARFPLPAGWDLDLTIDWVIPRGIAGGVVMAHPGGRLESAIVLDPATEGLDAGWIAGQLDHGGRGWALGIVLDTPLTGSIARGDMPGVHGSSSRTALQSLAIRVAPFGHVLAVTGQIGAARSIEGGIARGGLPVLEPGTTWLRAPSTTITLAPVWVLGPRVPVLLAAELRHEHLQPYAAGAGTVHVDHAAADLVLTGHWHPGDVVDLGVHGGWYGDVTLGPRAGEEALWLMIAGGGADAGIALEGPVSEGGLAHRIELDLALRGAGRVASGDPADGLASLSPEAPPSLLAGLRVDNVLVQSGVRRAHLAVEGWVLPPMDGRTLGVLAFEIGFASGPFGLASRLDLPTDRFRPSLARTALTVRAGSLVLGLEHLWIDRVGVTGLDLDGWLALPWSAAWQRAGGIHTALVTLGSPVGPGLELGLGAGIDLAAARHAWLEASLGWVHPCRCFRASVTVLARSGLPTPDVIVTVGI